MVPIVGSRVGSKVGRVGNMVGCGTTSSLYSTFGGLAGASVVGQAVVGLSVVGSGVLVGATVVGAAVVGVAVVGVAVVGAAVVGGSVPNAAHSLPDGQSPVHRKYIAFDVSIVASSQLVLPSHLTVHKPVPQESAVFPLQLSVPVHNISTSVAVEPSITASLHELPPLQRILHASPDRQVIVWSLHLSEPLHLINTRNTT